MTTNAGTEGPSFHASRALDMAVHDALPPDLRDALNYAPIQYSAVEVAQLLQRGYTPPRLVTLLMKETT
jgi:hypothetical protein